MNQTEEKTAREILAELNEKANEQRTTKKYLCGVLDSCPIQQLTVAGVSFPRYTQKKKTVGTVETVIGLLEGTLVELSDEKVAEVNRMIDLGVVHWDGAPSEHCPYGVKGDVFFLGRQGSPPDKDRDYEAFRIWERQPVYKPRLGDTPLRDHIVFKLVEKPEDAPQFFASDAFLPKKPIDKGGSSAQDAGKRRRVLREGEQP